MTQQQCRKGCGHVAEPLGPLAVDPEYSSYSFKSCSPGRLLRGMNTDLAQTLISVC